MVLRARCMTGAAMYFILRSPLKLTHSYAGISLDQPCWLTLMQAEVEVLRAQLAAKEAELAASSAALADSDTKITDLASKYDKLRATLATDQVAIESQEAELVLAEAAAASACKSVEAAQSAADVQQQAFKKEVSAVWSLVQVSYLTCLLVTWSAASIGTVGTFTLLCC